MIAIIDYGVGNLRSVEKALESLGYQAIVTADAKVAQEAEKVILPGVGAFGKSMESLERAGMVSVVKEIINSNRPFLGICLGLQMLFDESFEIFDDSKHSFPGLGILPGRVLRFPTNELKVPQIGWNQIKVSQDTPLFHGVPDGSFVYFVHSYYVDPAQSDIVACKTQYGIEYCSGVALKNLFAVQFHPEKSSQIGLRILKNFAEL